jgi:hypothetical protein
MALTERHVTTAGAGTHDGTSLANAFTLAEFVTDFNATAPGGGFLYNIYQSSGYTSGASITLTADGSATSPNKIRGCKTTPGDATSGRTTGGALDQSNMPTLTLSSTFRLILSGSTQLIIESLKITGSVANSLVVIGADSLAVNCVIENASTSASAVGLQLSSVTAEAIGNDITLANGVAGSKGIQSAGVTTDNRVKNAGGTGISVEGTIKPISHNTIYESGIGIATTSTTTAHSIQHNTIANCSGAGIEIVTATTVIQTITGNHITGNGGAGINFNTSTCPKVLINNRFRDNSGGAIAGDGDWGLGTNQLNITSDDTDATDFTDQSTDDYSLRNTAAGAGSGLSYLLNIGAEGTPAGSSGGGRIQPQYHGVEGVGRL